MTGEPLPDLVISLGPNCRNTFNVRAYFGFDRAYPFDWWITPMRSALEMLRPDFSFDVDGDDLLVLETGSLHNTVYNRRLHVLHHHDFPRHGHKVAEPSREQLENLNSKYRYLFNRMHDDIAAATHVLFVSQNLQQGLSEVDSSQCRSPELAGGISLAQTGEVLNDLFKGKARLLAIDTGEPAEAETPLASWIRRPDDGSRLYPPEHRFAYAEPTNVYRRVFDELGLGVTRAADFHPEQIRDPEDELQRA